MMQPVQGMHTEREREPVQSMQCENMMKVLRRGHHVRRHVRMRVSERQLVRECVSERVREPGGHE